MKGSDDDVTPTAGADRSDCDVPAQSDQKDSARSASPGVINLDSPLIGAAQGQITMCACTDFEDPLPDDDDAFEPWACWPLDHDLWESLEEPCADLRNPPAFILRELCRD